jgi:hypothetical protein
MIILNEDDLRDKFTHRFNLNTDKFKVNDKNFDLQYYDCAFEFKQNQAQFDLAFAEILLNSGKQRKYFRKYAIVYHNGDDYELKSFDYEDRLIDNMSIKYENETPSNPSEDAKIFYKKLQNTIVFQKYIGDDIEQFITDIENATYQVEVSTENVYKLFYEWFDWIEFTNKDKNKMPQDKIIQIFLCDILDNTVYNPTELFFDGKETESTTNFIYKDGVYKTRNEYYEIKSDDWHKQFWKNYKLPPTREVYNYIAEHRNRFFDDAYRKERGAQYTPKILVQKQWEILTKNELPPDADVIWLDFACGTCNLLMDVPDKSKCYVSTIDEGDVLIAKNNGFNNCVQFDFLRNGEMPKFMYKGEETNILKIIKEENKPVVVVMNPPYEKKRYKKMLNKMVRKLKNFRIFYYMMGTFLKKDEIFKYKCKVIEGIYTSLKVFGLTNSGVPAMLLEFGKNAKPLIKDKLTLPVFHPVQDKWDGWELKYKRDVTYKKNKESFRKQIEKQIKKKYNSEEKLITTMSFLKIPWFGEKGKYKVSKSNLKECLLFAGTFFNSHINYDDDTIYAADKKFSKSFIADALLLAMCYNTNITTEGFSIYTEEELGLPPQSLKAMPNGEMFYDFMNQYKNNLSKEGKNLREKTLKLYNWYFKKFGRNANKNVSLSELKLAIMQNTFRVSFEKKENTKISVTGMGSTRIGINNKWTPQKADKIHDTNIFMEYDKALLSLQTKMYERFIEYGMIDAMPKNVR